MKGRAVVAGAVAAGLTLTGVTAIGAAAAAATGNQIVVRISNSHMSFSSGSTIRPGSYTFKVVSADGHDHTLQLLELHKGYTLQQAGADVNKAFQGDLAAIRRVDSRITWRGGAEAHRSAGYFATTLAAHQYVAIDQASNVVRFLTVTGTRRSGSVPATTAHSTAYSYGFGDSARMPANGWVQLYNQADQPHFFVFMHVRQATTRAQVKRYFSSESQQQPSWALRSNTSSGVISPYHSEAFHLNLPAGKYVIACFWPDDDTGMPHAFMGMWDIVQLV